jgi:hypothetical protein
MYNNRESKITKKDYIERRILRTVRDNTIWKTAVLQRPQRNGLSSMRNWRVQCEGIQEEGFRMKGAVLRIAVEAQRR